MSWNPKYFIVYPSKMINELDKPEGYSFITAGSLSEVLCDVLKVKSIGSEIKLIWNDKHKSIVLRENNISDTELENYIKADCSILSFKTEFMRNKVLKLLNKMGRKTEIICVNNYRDVIVCQSHFRTNGSFPVLNK